HSSGHHEHSARGDVTVAARSLIQREVPGEGALKLKRNPLTHDTDTIHCIHQGFDVCRQQIPLLEFDHAAIHCSILIVPGGPHHHGSPGASLCKDSPHGCSDRSGHYSDLRHESPGHVLVHHEFRLPSAATITVERRVGPVLFGHDVPIDPVEPGQVVV